MDKNFNTRWSSNCVKTLVDAVNDTIKDDPEKFEKPVANVFYNKIREANADLMKFTWKGMRDKIRYLKGKYKAAVDWRNQTGQGLQAESGELCVKEYILKICPYFDELDEMFGGRVNTNIKETFDSEETILFDILDTANEDENYIEEKVVESDAEVDINHGNSFTDFKKQLKTGKRVRNNAVDYLISMKDQNEKNRDDKFKLEQLRAEENYILEKKKLNCKKR